MLQHIKIMQTVRAMDSRGVEEMYIPPPQSGCPVIELLYLTRDGWVRIRSLLDGSDIGYPQGLYGSFEDEIERMDNLHPGKIRHYIFTRRTL